MAAPQFVPRSPTDVPRDYHSPELVPDPWYPGAPGAYTGRFPTGEWLGYPGPDQGYALKLVRHIDDQIVLQPGEHRLDAVKGCIVVAMRRAALYGRAPILDDVKLAFTIWGFLDPSPPAELVAKRGPLFAEVGAVFNYSKRRSIADLVPEATLRLTLAEATRAYPARWRELLGDA